MEEDLKQESVYHVVLIDKRFNPDDMAPLLLGLTKLRENVFCSVFAYVMIPGSIHLVIKEKEKNVVGCIEYLHDCCYGDTDFKYAMEEITNSDRFLEIFAHLAQIPVNEGLVDTPGEYGYGSWVNDYIGMCSINVCQRLIVLRRFGFDVLYDWVNNGVFDDIAFVEHSIPRTQSVVLS